MRSYSIVSNQRKIAQVPLGIWTTQLSPLSKMEIIEIVNSLKNNNAAGEDSIKAELLKVANEETLHKLFDVF